MREREGEGEGKAEGKGEKEGGREGDRDKKGEGEKDVKDCCFWLVSCSIPGYQFSSLYIIIMSPSFTIIYNIIII